MKHQNPVRVSEGENTENEREKNIIKKIPKTEGCIFPDKSVHQMHSTRNTNRSILMAF